MSLVAGGLTAEQLGFAIGRKVGLAGLGLAARGAGMASRFAGRRINRAARGFLRRRARKRQPAARSRGPAKRARKAAVGERVGTSVAKRSLELDTAVQSLQTRTLYQTELTSIGKSTDNEIDERQRDMANIRGFRICMDIQNKTAGVLQFNIAVICPKETSGLTLTNFFRNNGAQRGADFGVSLTSQQFNCLAINADKYAILWRKKFTMAASDNDPITNMQNQYKIIKKYIPFDRQVRYEGGTTQLGQCFLVYWCDVFHSPSTTPALPNSFALLKHVVTYFREPKN